MKLFIFFFVLSSSAFSQVEENSHLQRCHFKLVDESAPTKAWTDSGLMVFEACEAHAHLYLRLNDKTYKKILYQYGKQEWKTLLLKDVKDEVAHP